LNGEYLIFNAALVLWIILCIKRNNYPAAFKNLFGGGKGSVWTIKGLLVAGHSIIAFLC
jgi:hypothetical protein